MSLAADLLVSPRMLTASCTSLPRIRSATRRTFCAEACRCRNRAVTSMSRSSAPASGLLRRSRWRGRRGRRGARRRRRPHRGLRRLLAAVAAEGAGHRELAELVAHHVLAHVHRDELEPVVHRDRVAHHLGNDRRAPRPGLDDPLVAARVHRRHLVEQVAVTEEALLERTRHPISLPVGRYLRLRRRTIIESVRLLLRVL